MHWAKSWTLDNNNINHGVQSHHLHSHELCTTSSIASQLGHGAVAGAVAWYASYMYFLLLLAILDLDGAST